jgi:hypothetical protein
VSGVGTEYICAVGAIFGLIVFYGIDGSGGYGVFKLAAWIHPLLLAGLTASMIGLSRWLTVSGHRGLSLLPLCVLLAYVGFNVPYAIHLGAESVGRAHASVNNAPQLQMEDFRELQQVSERWGKEGIVVALPDPVVQRWLVPFFTSAITQFFPVIHLNVEDSQPRPERREPLGKYLLGWADNSHEIVHSSPHSVIWRNRVFALTPLAECSNVMIFGLGWYRKEAVSNSPMEWQHQFRWLRRRGELLILNPSTHPKRILLNVISGFGNASPARHIDVYLNGTKFDEIDFSAQARVVTRPFVAGGPWSQVELAIREEAKPLARNSSLWNRSVPADARRLNIAVTEAALIDADQTGDALESTIEFGPGKRSSGLVRGVYPDGWIGEAADITLRIPPRPIALEINGTVPDAKPFSFPYQVALSLDGVRLEQLRIAKPGKFRVRVRITGIDLVAGRPAQLTVGPLATFSGRALRLNDDARMLSLLLTRVAFATGSPDCRESPAPRMASQD